MGARFAIFSFCFGYCYYISSLYNPTEYEQLKEICAFIVFCIITKNYLKYFMQTSETETEGLIKFSFLMALPFYVLYNYSIHMEQPTSLQNVRQYVLRYGSVIVYWLFVINGIYNILKDKGFDFQSTVLKNLRTTKSKSSRKDRAKASGSSKRNTTLKDAILDKDYEKVKELLQQGADPNAIVEDGAPVLLVAINNNRTDIVELLLQKGANVNFVYENASIIELAVVKGNKNIVKLLLQKGANPNVIREGCSTLDLAVSKGDQDIINLLREYGAISSMTNENVSYNNFDSNLSENQTDTFSRNSSIRRRRIVNSPAIISANKSKKNNDTSHKKGRRLEL